MILTIIIAAVLLLLGALIDTADRTGQRKTALAQCATLNVLLWVGILFWVASARRSGWETDMLWGVLLFAWAAVAVCAVFWWLVLASKGEAQLGKPEEQTVQTEMHPIKINGQYRSETTIDEDMLRSKYRSTK